MNLDKIELMDVFPNYIKYFKFYFIENFSYIFSFTIIFILFNESIIKSLVISLLYIISITSLSYRLDLQFFKIFKEKKEMKNA
jgi:hypothetical protein